MLSITIMKAMLSGIRSTEADLERSKAEAQELDPEEFESVTGGESEYREKECRLLERLQMYRLKQEGLKMKTLSVLFRKAFFSGILLMLF